MIIRPISFARTIRGVVGIILPFLWIVLDIFRNFCIAFFIPDYVFMIIALPNFMDIGVFSKPFGNTYFKPPNN